MLVQHHNRCKSPPVYAREHAHAILTHISVVRSAGVHPPGFPLHPPSRFICPYFGHTCPPGSEKVALDSSDIHESGDVSQPGGNVT